MFYFLIFYIEITSIILLKTKIHSDVQFIRFFIYKECVCETVDKYNILISQ